MNRGSLSGVARRDLLKSGAALLVTFAAKASGQAPSPTTVPPLVAGPGAGQRAVVLAGPSPEQLDSFIALRADGGFIAYFGKIDAGQGIDVAIAQIVAEELDVQPGSVEVVLGDTEQTVDQGGASAGLGIEKGAIPLRYAAAEARRLLIARAAETLKLPPARLMTADGHVIVQDEPSRRIAYSALRSDQGFATTMKWNGELGNFLNARGVAEPKPPSTYKVVGKSVPRADLRENAFGTLKFVTDVRLKDMLHARVIRPSAPGSEPTAIDKSSIAHIAGAQLVHEKGFLAVLAPREWDAIRAAQALKVDWSPPARFPVDAESIFDHIRASPPTAASRGGMRGDAPGALAKAAKRLSATYAWPFQSHASMGPACAVANVTGTRATIWSGSQKPHGIQQGVSKLLGMPPSRVRAIWVRGPGSYGRNDAGDAALEAAYLSRAVGKPVRLQYMRDQATAWDPKGPATMHFCEAGLDAAGAVQGFAFKSKGFSRFDVSFIESDPRDTLIGQMIGLGHNHRTYLAVPEEPYAFADQAISWETVAPLLPLASPLRTAHLRDPLGYLNFATECFLDELAHASGQDPVAFRLRHLQDSRAIGVIKAVAARAKWGEYVSPRPVGDMVFGRGVAFAKRFESYVAVVVDIELNRATGVVRPVRWTVAHDCGLVINPGNLDLTIEGNIVQGTSRALLEEVSFDTNGVTSVDWITYPILEISLAPDTIDIVQINRPEVASGGAGETAMRPVAAAIGNAIFAATGVRMRRAPLTPARIQAALAKS
jgi:nicotinate dehydrogenase subunit B